MFEVTFLAVLLFAVVQSTPTPTAPPDFSFMDSTGDWEFIFHKAHQLMLVKHHYNCYYFHVTADADVLAYLRDDHREALEAGVKNLILNDAAYKIRQVDLSDVREEFNDLLADFQCLHNDVFFVDPFATTPAPSTTTDVHGHTQTPKSTTTDNSGLAFLWFFNPLAAILVGK